jgi:hypothetical protein
MAARYRRKHLELSREKIKTSQLLNRLQDNGLAEKNFLDPNQIRCIEILLRKCLPDLSATELTGDVASFVMRLPEPAQDTATWEATTSVQHARDMDTKH